MKRYCTILVAISALSASTAAEELIPVIPAWGGILDTIRTWGKLFDGLQMAVYPDTHSGYVYCWIRNGSSTPIIYNDHYIGYFSQVRLEVKRGLVWQEIRRDMSDRSSYIVEGTGTITGDVYKLETLQIMGWAPWQDHLRIRNGKPVPVGPGSHFSFETYRDDLPRPINLAETFRLDLGGFEWPADILKSDTLELRVTQISPEVQAPPFEIKTSDLKELLDLLKHPKE